MNFIVLVHASEDRNLKTAVSKLSTCTTSGLNFFASIDCALFDIATVDPKASIHCNGQIEQVQLLHWLAHNMDSLDNLRVIGAVGGSQSNEALDSIDKTVKRLIEVVKTMSGHLVVEQFRVACPTYSSIVPRGSFFSSLAKANIVVIPRDSATHRSIAYPIQEDGSDDMASHIAVELSAIFGMWKEMGSSAADGFVTPSDIQDIRVQFVSSRVSLLDCPALPIHSVMSHDGELPLPYQYLSVPDSLHATEKYAQAIYPAELRFVKTEPPFGHLVSVEGKKFKGLYLKELLKAFTQTPKALIQGVHEHLEQMGGEALQEAVGGANSSIEVIYPGRDSGAEDLVITSKHIDVLIEEIADRNDRPVISTIGEQTWAQIVEKVISVVDGGPAASEIRSTYSNEKYLITRQSSLSPDVQNLNELLCEIYNGDQSNLVSEAHESDQTLSKEVSTDDSKEFTEENSVQEMGDDSQVAITPVVDLLVPSSEIDNSITNVKLAEVLVSEPVYKAETELAQESVRRNLLGRITQLMHEEGRVARSRSEEMVDTLRNLPGEFSASEVTTISSAVKFAVAFGISLIYFTIGALTSRRNLFNFEFFDDKPQSLLWVLITSLLVFAAAFGLVSENNGKWQGKVIIASTALVVLLSLEFVFWDSIWNIVMKFKMFRGGPLAAALLLIGALVVIVISITRNRLAESKVRQQFASLLFVVSWIYVIVGTTAAAGSDRSPIWSNGKFFGLLFTNESRPGIRNVGFAAGLTLLIVSGFVVAFTIVRERYKLEELSRKLIWASSELESSIDAEKRLRLASVQWTGTASVIARLFRFPLGTNVAGHSEFGLNNCDNFKVLKFDQQRLDLTRKGEQGLTARVRQLFVARNWLGRQYRQLISKFQEDLAFEQGLDSSEDAIQRPETCPAVPSIEEVLSGQARGPRWTFMSNVFSGVYDDALLETTSEVQLEAAYSTIVDDSDAHSVGDTKLIAPQFFERLIPEEGPLLPAGLVSKLFTGADKQQIMSTNIWWPDELIARPRIGHHANFRASSVLTPEKITDPIRLLGTCVLISVPFLLDEVGEANKNA